MLIDRAVARSTSRPRRHAPGRVIAIATAICLLLSVIAGIAARPTAAVAPLYPDLRSAAPFDFWLDTEVLEDGKRHYLVRFANRVENWGGPFEVTSSGSAGNRRLTQIVYNDYWASQVVERIPFGADLIYHPQHGHFHITDFSQFILLKKNANGVYVPTTKRGDKTTFCVADTETVGWGGPYVPSTRGMDVGCGTAMQGLTPGWGDTYPSYLYGQWVDLGFSQLADGDYAIQTTADPLNRIKESNERNNTNLAFFSMRGARISTDYVPSFCTQKVMVPVPVGSEAQIVCSGLPAGKTFDLRFGTRDGAIIGNGTANAEGKLFVPFTMPPASKGTHFVHVVARSGPLSLTAAVQTAPSMSVSPTQTKVGTAITVTLHGFASREMVTIIERRAGIGPATLGSVKTNAAGSATIEVAGAQAEFGKHVIEATGADSKSTVTDTIRVNPSVAVSKTSAQRNEAVRITLRGFAGGETVRVTIDGRSWATFVVSGNGSAGPSTTTQLVIPKAVSLGQVTIRAIGTRSDTAVTVRITIVAPPTPTSTPPPPSPSPTSSPDPSATTGSGSLSGPDLTPAETIATPEKTPAA